MPPFDFLNPLRRVGTGIRRGVGYLGDQFDPNRLQPMPQGTDVNPAELEQVRRALPPGINGQPNPATQRYCWAFAFSGAAAGAAG